MKDHKPDSGSVTTCYDALWEHYQKYFMKPKGDKQMYKIDDFKLLTDENVSFNCGECGGLVGNEIRVHKESNIQLCLHCYDSRVVLPNFDSLEPIKEVKTWMANKHVVILKHSSLLGLKAGDIVRVINVLTDSNILRVDHYDSGYVNPTWFALIDSEDIERMKEETVPKQTLADIDFHDLHNMYVKRKQYRSKYKIVGNEESRIGTPTHTKIITLQGLDDPSDIITMKHEILLDSYELIDPPEENVPKQTLADTPIKNGKVSMVEETDEDYRLRILAGGIQSLKDVRLCFKSPDEKCRDKECYYCSSPGVLKAIGHPAAPHDYVCEACAYKTPLGIKFESIEEDYKKQMQIIPAGEYQEDYKTFERTASAVLRTLSTGEEIIIPGPTGDGWVKNYTDEFEGYEVNWIHDDFEINSSPNGDSLNQHTMHVNHIEGQLIAKEYQNMINNHENVLIISCTDWSREVKPEIKILHKGCKTFPLLNGVVDDNQ